MGGTWGEGWEGHLSQGRVWEGEPLGWGGGPQERWDGGASDSVAKKELAAHSAHSGFETLQDKQHMGNIKLYTMPGNCFVFLYQVTAVTLPHRD